MKHYTYSELLLILVFFLAVLLPACNQQPAEDIEEAIKNAHKLKNVSVERYGDDIVITGYF